MKKNQVLAIFYGLSLISAVLFGNTGLTWAEDEKWPGWIPKILGLQFAGIYQNMPAFTSPYAGDKSLIYENGKGQDITRTYGLYLGSQVTQNLQAYLDVEMFNGDGLSNGLGLGGYINGDVIRAGSQDLGKAPYLARFFLRYLIPLSPEMTPVERGMDQLPGKDPVSRVEIKLGKLTLTDDFDQNRYANNNRTQFLNYSFLYNPAWDYASDTRGYSLGFTLALVMPAWRLVFGSFQVPSTMNGIDLDPEIYQARGDNLELTLKPNKQGTAVRFLVYRNQSRMGSYEESLAIGRRTNTIPDLVANEKPGREKYGFGINFEQPLADNGETGLFARMSWNNGQNTNYMYTDVDRHISLGVQVSGVHWGRPEDRLGLAGALNGISAEHRSYLEAGGMGLLTGDGRLNYAWERIFEIYYRFQIGRYIQISPDFQYIQNPGYNSDRGPVAVYSLRLRLSY